MSEFVLIELEGREQLNVFNKLMTMYHKQGWRPGLGRGRYFVLAVEEQGTRYWVAGAVLQDPIVFARALKKFNVDMTHSYFIRRICKFAPGEYLLTMLKLLAEKMRNEGKELLITMGLDDHSNALYKKAGFKEIGETISGKPVFVLELQKIW